MKYQLVIVSFCYIFKLCYSQQLDGPTIETDRGLIKGIKEILSGIEINSYLGIPYALPPVGPRRYEATYGLRKNFTGVFHANQYGPVCYQSEKNAAMDVPGQQMSEGCLSLNIWTPKDAPGQILYPVLISLYGSNSRAGAASEPNMRSDYLTAFTSIISVNMNYRLGTLGFAYDGTDQFIGNQAIHDFLLAADWVRSNIRAFGGDPERITVGGYSAGAILLSAIFMSPTVPTNWFKRLVFFDGAAVEHATAFSDSETFKSTKQVVNQLGCSEYSKSNNSLSIDEIVCLKAAPAKAIVNTPSNEKYLLTYGDKYILPVRPSVLINTKKYPKGSTMLLITEPDEAVRNRNLIEIPKNVTAAINLLSELLYEVQLTSVADAKKLVQLYFTNVTEFDIPLIEKQVDAFLSNFEIQCPSLLHSIAYSRDQANAVYSFRNNYLTQLSLSQGRPFGTHHGDGHNLFFGLPYRFYEWHSDKDRETSLFMMNVLGDFIKGKDPFWSPVNVTGHRPDQIFLPRWNIKNNVPLTNVDYDQDKEICLIWAKYFKLNIASNYY